VAAVRPFTCDTLVSHPQIVCIMVVFLYIAFVILGVLTAGNFMLLSAEV
jgi:hypothetical protein